MTRSINAKEEFDRWVKFWQRDKKRKLKCAYISYMDNETCNMRDYHLPVGFSTQEYEKFLKEIDFEYTCEGYAYWSLDGYIWYDDGTWDERHYNAEDGCWEEYWVHIAVPDIVKGCLKKEEAK